MDLLNTYEVEEEIQKTREMGFLDSSRHPHYPDDVQVYLVRDGLQPEVCWTRIIGLGDHWIMGILLNEPNQNFDYHQGEKIAFFVEEDEEKGIICWSDMTPSQILKPEDLEDGCMLRSAITAFNTNRTEQGLIEIMEILRDSYVWVPCNAILSDVDQKAFAELISNAGNDLKSMVGMELSNQENIRMVPDILQNGDDFFFPAFISTEDMGEYGQHFSKVQKQSSRDHRRRQWNRQVYCRGIYKAGRPRVRHRHRRGEPLCGRHCQYGAVPGIQQGWLHHRREHLHRRRSDPPDDLPRRSRLDAGSLISRPFNLWNKEKAGSFIPAPLPYQPEKTPGCANAHPGFAFCLHPSQGFDGIQVGCLYRRQQAENHADEHGEHHGNGDGAHVDGHRDLHHPGDQLGKANAAGNTDDAAKAGKSLDRLDKHRVFITAAGGQAQNQAEPADDAQPFFHIHRTYPPN